MMISFCDIFKPKETKYNVNELFETIRNHNAWSNNDGDVYSPQMVLDNPSNKKYKDDIKRIRDSNLKYPIIIVKDKKEFSVANGYHRIIKAKQQGKKDIRTIVFDYKMLEKFYLLPEKDFDELNERPVFEIINLFVERFGISKPSSKQNKLTFSELVD